jgi:DNA modification methylase
MTTDTKTPPNDDDRALSVEYWPIERLVPYANNPRTIPQAAIDKVARSIAQFGFRQPIVVDDKGVVIVGHVRLAAARQLALTEVPVHVARGLSAAHVKAYRLADNRSAQETDWDAALLGFELTDLAALGLELDLTGFEADEIARYAGEREGLCDPEQIPAPPPRAETRRGDLIGMGDNLLLCGDAGAAADLDRVVGAEPVDLVHGDPPYGVHDEPRSANAIAAGKAGGRLGNHQRFDDKRRCRKATGRALRAKDRPLAGDDLPPADYERLLGTWFANLARVLKPGGSFYLWGGYANFASYPPALAAAGLYFSQALVWVKGHPVLGRKDFMGDHEWCYYGWREGAAHRFYGPPNVSDVWVVKKVSPQAMLHLTEKPVELALRALRYSSKPGEVVLDPFAGSGSTLIACLQAGRRARLVEVDPLYCDVIRRRYELFTGHEAVLLERA